MKRIPLTQGKFACVDDCDYVYLMQWKWYYDGKYSVRNGYINNKRRTIRMHRVILGQMGFKDFAKSDHINRDRLDNRRCNLRPATHSQSSCNRGKPKNNTSGYHGVWWEKRREKWFTRIGVKKKQIFLGYFDDPKEAARVYNKAVFKYHGEFANLNEVD